ncbi:sensor histidine kinase [Streptomyces sp. FIT100]|uniref:sensor histidine kinase n=1 Tax=Streptomyces sp. FIT100 TaxID=2837956 RepID=UPI0021C8E507|nr:histidine kinase [Streptomyces sp. FIT100]UUN27777.1 two-component sensor histidine kinase [Streptomyces sp. FIT100]
MRLPRRIRLSAEQVAVVCALAEPLTVLDESGPLALAVCVPALLALPLRRRLPVTALCATLPAMVTGYLLLPWVITMYAVASSRPQGRVLWPSGLLIAAAVCPWPLPGVADKTLTELLNAIEVAALLSVGSTALGLLARARAQTQAQLARLEASQAREQRLGAEQAVIRERARLARDMHDTVSHHLSIIAVQAGALRAVESDPAKRADVESIRKHSVRALEELRDTVGVLRRSGILGATAAGRPHLADLPGLAADSALDVTTDLRALTERSWPPGVETAVYRIVQEALTNVRKHAPGAPVAISALLAEDRESLVLEVRNGPAAHRREDAAFPAGGHGLVGLRERAERLGGRLDASPGADGGFLVRAVLPL